MQKRIFLVFLTLQLAYINSYGQFFTICAESGHKMEAMNEEALYDTTKVENLLFKDTIQTSQGPEREKSCSLCLTDAKFRLKGMCPCLSV